MFHEIPWIVEAERLAGVKHARIVIASTTDDATALAIAAIGISHLDRDYVAAVSAIERALSLNASCATALYFGAHVHACNGNVDVAPTHAHRALRLSPFDPLVYEARVALGLGFIQEARYEEAVTEFAKMVQANPVFSSLHFLYAMGLALAGRAEDAQPAVEKLELEPSFSSRLIYQIGLTRQIADRLAEGARILGLPEERCICRIKLVPLV